MGLWTLGIAVVAINVGNHFGDTWGLLIGVLIGPLVLARIMRASLARR